MVKSKDDYDRRSDDSRFKNFDKVLDPSYGQKQYYILIVGILIVCSMFIISAILTSIIAKDTETDILYEEGLNISYIAEDKIFSIQFTNPKSDTLMLSTVIKTPFDTQSVNPSYLTVYEYSSSKFPTTINYTPSTKIATINHFVTVTLLKETGNYTYTYSAIPETENKMWDGIGKYIDAITGVFNKK